MSRLSKPKDMRLIATFAAGTVPQYDDYLLRNPDMKGSNYDRTYLGPKMEKELEKLFYFIASGYQSEVGDHWDHTLPGDCENQCLYLRAYVKSRGWNDVFDCMRLVLCKTNSRAKRGHAVLCFDEINSEGQLAERIMDFNLREPLLPIGHKAFDSYLFFRVHTPGTASWQYCIRKDRRQLGPVEDVTA